METPLSSRRITRSQALISSSKGENEESLKGVSKSRQETGKHQEREKSAAALIDITNGSPIVGLAMGSLKTPKSRCSKKRTTVPNCGPTPGSGESILRGQVKTLLQKVEEEGVISKICFEPNPLIRNRNRFMNSPMAVLAPTPANTPQLFDFSTSNLESFTVSPIAENFNFTQMLNEIISDPNQEENKSETGERNVITRSLFMDFSEKFEGSDSSAWSVQVNPSTRDDVTVDELCEGISNISVSNSSKFTGKHIRFVYNSDGELEGQLSSSSSKASSGLPTPKGKHLMFAEDSEEESSECSNII